MKRSILAVLTICFLTMAGAAVAQSTLNTTAPGPTTQRDPGQTNNNLPNPGNPVPQPSQPTTQTQPTMQTQPMTDPMSSPSTSTSAPSTMVDDPTESVGDTDSTTGRSTTGIGANERDTTLADDVRTGTTATGNAVRGATETDTTADTTTGGSYSADDQSTLPNTASDMPLVAVIGLLSLGAALLVRFKA